MARTKLIGTLLVLFGILVPACCFAQSARLPSRLPAESWQIASGARGIQFNGRSGQAPTLQIVCDAHCPYCARLYVTLREEFAEVPARWVPVAYFKRNSSESAAALLNAPAPSSALDVNYRHYDYSSRRGGYGAASGMLDYEHEVLKQHWTRWGGFTPMILAKTGDGRVFRARDGSARSIREVLDAVANAGSR